MEEHQNRDVHRIERGQSRVEDLHLDRIISSQPEIGPTPPDGGYGWLIVVSAIVYHITVPSVLSLYGLIILKAIKEEDHDENELLQIWDVDIALVPVITVVMRLLLESWCRTMVKTFNMPRFMALSGLCLTVAGVLLSSYTIDVRSNDHIISVFSGMFIDGIYSVARWIWLMSLTSHTMTVYMDMRISTGTGCALTGQQTELIITHYFRDKLTMVQRIIRMAPSIGNCLTPILVGYLCTQYTADVVIMIYGAILMQNCLFLAAYTRPVYIVNFIRTTYNMLRDAGEDDDDVIFSKQNRANEKDQISGEQSRSNEMPNATQDEDADIVVYNSRTNAREIIDPSIQQRENRPAIIDEDRFSTDFSSMFEDNPSTSNRFSSDFGTFEVVNSNRIKYQELQNIDTVNSNPQPLYRGTTVDAPPNLVFTNDMTPGSARRTASAKKHLITVWNMLKDINFYLYALLNLCTTFSILVLGMVFPSLMWELNPSMNIWSVAMSTAIAHGGALSFIIFSTILPKSFNAKARLCTAFCIAGAFGFSGVLLSSNKSVLVIFCMLASFATAASSILQQPFYVSALNDFNTTATITTSNSIAAIIIMIWSLVHNYNYRTCFLTASGIQVVTACVFSMFSFRRQR